MIALVTGATGFLGREVVKALRTRDIEVRCLVHTPGREQILAGRGVDVHYGSVGDPAALRAAIYNVDAVVHLVGVIRESGPVTFKGVNRGGTQNVVEVAKREGVGHFVYVSAIGARDDHRYPYLRTKWQGEQAVIGSGMPYTILRPSIQFGEGDEFINTLAGLVRTFPVVPVAGPGKNAFQPIAVEEVARCVAESVGSEELKGKVIEIGGPDHLSYNAIVDIVARTYGVRRIKLHIPLLLMGPVVRLMEWLLPRPPATTQQLRMLPVPNIAQINTVEQVFGFAPKPLERNIDYIRGISVWEGLRISLGFMPRRIRDH